MHERMDSPVSDVRHAWTVSDMVVQLCAGVLVIAVQVASPATTN